MAKQLINLGASVNDGTGDTLRGGAVKINENFTELYNFITTASGQASIVTSIIPGDALRVNASSGNVTISSKVATTTELGVIKVDGTSIVINEAGTISSNVAASQLISGNVTLALEDDGDVTGRLAATGPLIVLTGGDGSTNANSNYTQLQWTSDLMIPDQVKSQYLWLDTNGISLQTNDPGVYSNTLHYGNDGILTFNDAGQVGPVQLPNGIDLYANANMAWAQLNYDNRNFFWVSNTAASVDVLSDDGLTNYNWSFSQSGGLTIAKDLNVHAGDIKLTNNSGIEFTDGSRLTTAFRPQILTAAERNALIASNGDMIYNSTTNRFQGFQDGVWVDLAPTTVDGGTSV